MKNILFTIFILFFCSLLIGGEIIFDSNPDSFKLHYKSNNKILDYKLLQPQKSIRLSVIGVDTLKVYTRLIIDRQQDYSYKITINGIEKNIQRTANPSKVTKGISGELVSAYNSFITGLEKNVSSVTITNKSPYKMLLKVDGNNIINNLHPIDYIRYSPSQFNNRINLEIDEKAYTYFSAHPREIEFTLEGPIYLKILSRLLFDNIVTPSYEYRYMLYIDDQEYAEYREKAYKSSKAVLPDNKGIIPSTGDTNIVKIPDGLHRIKISAPDINRDLIFRLFISKSAVEMSL